MSYILGDHKAEGDDPRLARLGSLVRSYLAVFLAFMIPALAILFRLVFTAK